MIDLIKTDIRVFNDNARKIIESSDKEALKDLFDGCDTVEAVNQTADELIKEYDI